MGGCAGKLKVDVSRLASLPRQISFTRSNTHHHNSHPQVDGKEEGEKVENKVPGNEEKIGGEDKKEAPLVDLSVEGEKSSDGPKTDTAAAAVPAESATESKVETPVVEVVGNAKPDGKVETWVHNSSEEKIEAPANSSEDKTEAAAVVSNGVTSKETEVKLPEAAPVTEPEESAKEPETKIEAVAKEPEAKQPETAPAKVEDKTDASSVAQ